MAPIVLTLLLFPATGTIWAGDHGRSYSAIVSSEVILPDGSVHPPGSLRIRLSRSYSPVSGLHEIFVNGAPIGMYSSRIGKAEGSAAVREPFFLFLRNDRNQLMLQGYAVSLGREIRIYEMAPRRDKPKAAEVTSQWELALDQSSERREHSDVVLVSAADGRRRF
jgi:hypothetical protein